MRRKAFSLNPGLWILLLCLICTGCGNTEFLDEIPKEYAVRREISGKSQGGIPEEVLEDTPCETEPEVVSFLMEEAFHFAFDRLSPAEQIWYRDMERILGSFGTKARLSDEGLEAGLGESDIDKIFQCVLCDHPELFYVEGYSYKKYIRGEQVRSIEFSGTYQMDPESALARREEILTEAEVVLDGIGKEASDYDKVKYVYETLICNTDYDQNVPDNQNIYSVFVHHLSVCQGYAKATQYLLNRLGVECTLVQGTVESGEGHAWNLVKIDDNYYYVDTTWGDVSYRIEEDASEDGAGTMTWESMPQINYDYLNVTTEELLKTHTLGGKVPMPVCTAVDANYYIREGALFTSCDREQMAKVFSSAIEQGRRYVTLKCADAAVYGEVHAALVGRQEIFDYLEAGSGSIAYSQNEKQYVMTFWVTKE